MEVKDRIKNRRLELGLTLEQVGNHVGVSKSTVRKWETGFISNMRRDKIAKLAEILQLSPIDLMDDPEIAYSAIQETMKQESEKIRLSISDIDPQISAIIANAKKLNAQGLAKLEEYSDDLVSSGKYEKTSMKDKAM